VGCRVDAVAWRIVESKIAGKGVRGLDGDCVCARLGRLTSNIDSFILSCHYADWDARALLGKKFIDITFPQAGESYWISRQNSKKINYEKMF